MVIKKVNLDIVVGVTSTLPETSFPEVAFAGKSNVGKSSLINALMNRKSYVRTSSQPGKTQTMNKDAIIFAMANPVPEIMPDVAKAAGARVVGTGRSDFPNQVNNVIAFPGIFKGALEGRARQITEDMKLAAALAIANLVPDDEVSDVNILPEAFDPRVADVVSKAVIDHIEK